MKFDIYKRATKEKRLDAIKSMNKPRISPQEVKGLISRFDRDLQRRQVVRKSIEAIQLSPKCSDPKARKMTKEESDKLYERMIRRHIESQKVLEKKRELLRQIKEYEETKELCQVKGSMNKQEIEGMLERFEISKARMKNNLTKMKEGMEKQKEQELKNYFRPKINPAYATSFSGDYAVSTKRPMENTIKSSADVADSNNRKSIKSKKLTYKFDNYDEMVKTDRPISETTKTGHDKTGNSSKDNVDLMKNIKQALRENVVDPELDEMMEDCKKEEVRVKYITSRPLSSRTQRPATTNPNNPPKSKVILNKAKGIIIS